MLETIVFLALGFTPSDPAAGSVAASLMSLIVGSSGASAGSGYAIAQSASMGGTATGSIATVGMAVGGLMVSVVVPALVAGRSIYVVRRFSKGKEGEIGRSGKRGCNETGG